ncbi:phosphate/phosphite/phosphonate ABC transporter substrate-binding protein [soil metagenome]
MIASLGMYDLPWLRPANDALWAAIVARLDAASIEGLPPALTRNRDLEDMWRSPALIFGQSCGYPLMTQLRETVQIVATPCYAAQGCEGSTHRAAIIVRAESDYQDLSDLKGARVGLNSLTSNTGMNLLRAQIAPIAGSAPFFGSVLVTGSHARSVSAILSGRIDVASVDAITLAHLQARYPRHASAIRILQWTAPSPGLPLIAAAQMPAATIIALRRALPDIAADPALAPVRRALLITDFQICDLDDYAPILAFEDAACRQGYADVR